MLSTTASINIDLQRPSIIVIHAKQFDALSRFAEIHLFSCGEPWSIDKSNNDKKEYAYAVQYRKPDGTKGLYDKLPDGETDAVTESLAPSGETVLRVRFAPQMFTVAGNVKCSVAIMQTGDGIKLQTCSFDVLVAASEVSGDESKDYYKMITLEGLQNQIGDLSNLTTTDKSSLVAAINEALGKFGELDAADIAANVDGIPADTVAVALAYLLDIIRRLDARNIPAQDFVDGINTVYDALLYLQALAQPCVVNMTKNADGTYTADKTFAELKAAHDAGKTVICSFNDLTQQWDGPVRLPVVDTTDVHMGFAGVIEPRQNYKIFAYVYINSDGMGHTATEIAAKDTVSTMIDAAIGDTATALSDMDSVIGGAEA